MSTLGLHLKLQPTRSDLVGLRPMARQAAARGRLRAGAVGALYGLLMASTLTPAAVRCGDGDALYTPSNFVSPADEVRCLPQPWRGDDAMT